MAVTAKVFASQIQVKDDCLFTVYIKQKAGLHEDHDESLW